MIIDVNAFIGQWPFYALSDCTTEVFKRTLDKHNIQLALVSSLDGIFHHDPQFANERLLEETVADYRIINVPVINPELPSWEKILDRDLKLHPIAGIKILPNYHLLNLDGDAFREFLTRFSKYDLPLIIQLRMEDLREKHPLLSVGEVNLREILDVVMTNFHKSAILLAGIKFSEILTHKQDFRENPLMFCDTSWIEGVNSMKRSVDAIGIEKILFGSHSPLFYMESQIFKIRRSGLSESEQGMIFHDNFKRYAPALRPIKEKVFTKQLNQKEN
jgi:uncharacterized protein